MGKFKQFFIDGVKYVSLSDYAVGQHIALSKDLKVFHLLSTRRIVYASYIVNLNDNRQTSRIRNLTRQLFQPQLKPFIPTYEWSGIITTACPTVEIRSVFGRNKQVGITMAHKRIWEDLVRRNGDKALNSSGTSHS